MDSRIILFIDNQFNNAVTVDILLSENSLMHSLFIAADAKNGLSLLLGDIHPANELHPETKKIRPEIIIVNKTLPDITAHEFLAVVRRYYTLRNAKMFVTAYTLRVSEKQLLDALHVSVYLTIPIQVSELIKKLRAELDTKNACRGIAPFSVGQVRNTQAGDDIKEAS